MWDPTAIADIQHAARSNDESAYWRFVEYVDQEVHPQLRTARSPDFKFLSEPIALDEVEPARQKS